MPNADATDTADLTGYGSLPDDQALSDVIDMCRDLIRIDTSNYGDNAGPGEREAAEYVAARMSAAGLEPDLFESAPGRASVVARMKGTNPDKPALVVHGHLDVVPAQAEDWSVDPFAAEVKDGLIWGRGAVDMKDMDAMILATMESMQRNKVRPERDLIFAMFADEEANGTYGSNWAVDNRPELFEGASEAISEVGGFSGEIAGQRVYYLQTAEKGLAWLRLIAHGRAGHGSQINTDNAVTRLAEAVAAIGRHTWPVEFTKTTEQFVSIVEDMTGVDFDESDPRAFLEQLGSVALFVGATFQNTSNPSLLKSGYKTNVIPGTAEAHIDVRTLPGKHDEVMRIIKELAGEHVDVEPISIGPSLETAFNGDLVDGMIAALGAEDPGAPVLPYTLSGGTDNKALSRLGITGYGFAPLRLPKELNFTSMFHGVDERVPVDSLVFGTKVLHRLLSAQ
ncbi:M20/M25/M40 family metallo-hydrolase [Falsarthrobacter nasiphocae]|uniref:Acetylornithine deacetylase/succinyl-diaminopimelate desuccinylase-like protein n=1 Tax=Falsarthrobacter nasiphocae TaxID=189863 RepID=A0AAE3YF81_9MICC|nr:M20/M25/M40 family metallo-hydrolase [Falsarthrobacter nasiphocae]MDR6891117.1 acetylornithine deacetylase/succinyl-diaminopimelate desuccinylase-like protein [Falsarthrobacter nasiphocae]